MKKLNYSRLLITFLIVLIPISIVSVALNTVQYRSMLIKTYVDFNVKITTNATRKIDYSMAFGKSLENFYGLNDLLENTKSLSDDIRDISIINNANDKSIAATKTMPTEIPYEIKNNDYVIDRNGFFARVVIDDNHTMVLLLDLTYVNDLTMQYTNTISIASLFIILGLILLSGIVYFILNKLNKGNIPSKNLKHLLVSLLVLYQAMLGMYVLSNYTDEYMKSVEKMTDAVSRVIDNDIESVVKQGVPFEELKGVDEYLQRICSDIDEFVCITIDPSSNNDSENQTISKKVQILDKNYYVNIEYKLNQQVLNNNKISLLLGVLILLVVTVLITIEVSSFIFGSNNKEKNAIKSVDLRGIRLFFFILFLIMRLDTGFISVLSQNLFYSKPHKENSEFLIGLPTTFTSIATAIGLVICLILVNKIGIKKIVTLGVILFSIGSMLSAFSNDLILFSLSRSVIGLGTAAIISSTKLCAVFEKNSKFRLEILASVAAGQIAGTSCGLVLGSLFSTEISYKFVFLLESILIIAVLFFIKITGLKDNNECHSVSPLSLVKFIKIPRMFMYMLLIIIPIYMANVFTLYVVPLFGQEARLSESIISALIMLNFVLSAYTSKIGTKIFMRLFGEQKSVLIYILITIFSIGLFSIFNNLESLIITVTLLGIADGFGLNIIFENVYRLQPNADTIVVMFSFLLVSRIGDAISPLLISSNTQNGIASASSILSYILAGGTILYILFLIIYAKHKRKKVSTI